MSSSRTANRGKAKQSGSAASSAMSDAAGSDHPPPAAAAAAASSAASSSRPRRNAAAEAHLKLMQQMFEAERTPVSSQPSDATAAAAATAAAPPRRGRPPKGTRAAAEAAAAVLPPAVSVKRAVKGKRMRVVPSSSPDSDEDEGEGEGEESDGGRAGPARRVHDRSSSSAHTRKKARGAARSDSDEEDELVARRAQHQVRKGSPAVSAAASRRQPQRRGRPARSSSSSSSDSSSDSDSEQSEDEQDEEEEEEEEEEDEMGQPPSDDEEQTAAAAAAPMTGSQSQLSTSVASAAAAVSAPSAVPLSVMELLDHSDGESEIGVMTLALQTTDESLAALLSSQSAQDGSTFLQRFYRVYCAMHTTGFTEHRARLMRLIERQGVFHASTSNHAGQTLLHTLCSKDTYTVKHRIKNRRRWQNPNLPEYSEWTTVKNRMAAFSDQLCTVLLKHGADFHAPDKAGFLPIIGLVECAKAGVIGQRVLSNLIFKAPKKARSQRSAAVPSPEIDLNVTDASGSTLLTLIFDKWSNKFDRWDWDPPMLAIAGKLCSAPRLLAQVDLFAQNERGQCAIQLLAQACRDVKPRRHWTPHPGSTPVPEETQMLPQRMLKAWQAARTPLLRAELNPWLIPDLADICCEYLLASTLKDGQEMSEEEQQRVFGLKPLDKKRTEGGSASGDEDDSHDDIMLDAEIGQMVEAAAATAAAALAAVDEYPFADMD